MTTEELDEIRAAADRDRASVSSWVRRVLREERERERTGRARTVREEGPAYSGTPGSPASRVRIELDLKEDLIVAVQDRYRLTSRRAAVEFALRRVAVTPMSKDEVLAMQGVGWDGDLDETRSGDPGAIL